MGGYLYSEGYKRWLYCTYDGERVQEDGCTFKSEGCKDGYTYNGMRVVGDGAADPLDLHQDQNKRHHSQ